MAPSRCVLSVFLLTLAAARADSMYATLLEYNSKTAECKAADANGQTTIWAFGVCAQSSVLSMEGANFTVTKYAANNCTGKGTVTFSAAVNVCAKLNGAGAMFTSSSNTFAQACNGFNYPWVVTYADNMCGVIATARAQTSNCYSAGGAGGASSRAQCTNGTAVECTYQSDKCMGDGTCKPETADPTNTCVKSASGAVKYVCPVNGATPFCPALPKDTTTTKSNTLSGGEIGGIVAAVILIPLVIIVVAVVAFIFIRKSKESSADSGLMGDGATTNYGSA